MTILNEFTQTVVTKDYLSFPLGRIIIGLLILGVLIVINYAVFHSLLGEGFSCTIFFISILICVGTFVGLYWHQDKIEIPTYEVTFNDTIPINEVYSKYKIIDHRGNIYTIQKLSNTEDN